MYPYKTVERALTRVHGDTGAVALRINAKVKHFIRLGFTPESPGKGQRISYTFENVAKWAYALQILEYGVDPTAMLLVVSQTWDRVWPAMNKGNHGQNELMVATPNAITHPDGWQTFDCRVQQFQTFQPEWSEVERTMIINVSKVSRNLQSALDDAEAGTLRDLSDEIALFKKGEVDFAHVQAALRNVKPGAVIAISGAPLVQERGEDGTWREVLPSAREIKRIAKRRT